MTTSEALVVIPPAELDRTDLILLTEALVAENKELSDKLIARSASDRELVATRLKLHATGSVVFYTLLAAAASGDHGFFDHPYVAVFMCAMNAFVWVATTAAEQFGSVPAGPSSGER